MVNTELLKHYTEKEEKENRNDAINVVVVPQQLRSKQLKDYPLSKEWNPHHTVQRPPPLCIVRSRGVNTTSNALSIVILII